MKTEVSICKGCGKKRPIINRNHWLCGECNQSRKNAHKEFLGIVEQEIEPESISPTQTTSAFVTHTKNNPKYVKKHTGELALFQSIWATRPHVSFLSGIPIEHFNVSNFAHCLPKAQNKYPQFKLFDKNIILLTETEHFLYDNGTMDSRARYQQEMIEMGYDCDWRRVYDFAAELKKEYECL